MLSVSEPGQAAGDAPLEAVLREVVQTLAPIDRTPCSPGEREAANWLAARLRAVPGVRVALEDEDSWGTFPPTATGLGLTGIIGAALVLRGRRAAGALVASAAFAGIVDEAHNGPRILRRLVRRRRRTVNVIARIDGHGAGGSDDREQSTLVVLAHHDAPQSGMLFDQTLQRRLYERAPQVLERFKTPLPQWWVGLGGGLATVVAALTGRRGFARAGLAVGLIGTAAVADIWRSETVPGANDNLSGAASLVALADLLGEHPIPGLRVLLVSCGAEETLQDGIRAFVSSHSQSSSRSAPLHKPRDGRLAPPGDARGRGAGGDGELRGPRRRDLFAAHAERSASPCTADTAPEPRPTANTRAAPATRSRRSCR